MTVRRGDVVLVRFPFSSGRGSKRRPAVVVQADRNNARLGNTIIAQITTNLSRLGEPTQVLVDPATPEGATSCLVSPSAVTCENVATIQVSRIARKIGELDPSLVQQVDDALRAALELT